MSKRKSFETKIVGTSSQEHVYILSTVSNSCDSRVELSVSLEVSFKLNVDLRIQPPEGAHLTHKNTLVWWLYVWEYSYDD